METLMTKPKLIRLPDVLSRVGLGRSKVYQLIKEGQFPAPVKIGRSSLWLEQGVSAWINERLEHG